MNDWILVETQSTPWIAGEARYDGAFLTKADAIASLVEDLPGLDAAITSWHASILEPVHHTCTGSRMLACHEVMAAARPGRSSTRLAIASALVRNAPS